MRSTDKPVYSITGSIRANDIKVYVILDKKNNSIHIHCYGTIFGNTQKPIFVKHADTKFPEDGDLDAIKQIVIGEFTNEKVQIEIVAAEQGRPAEQTAPPQRTIIRFGK